jgi:hypothetical protein
MSKDDLPPYKQGGSKPLQCTAEKLFQESVTHSGKIFSDYDIFITQSGGYLPEDNYLNMAHSLSTRTLIDFSRIHRIGYPAVVKRNRSG